MDLTTNYLGLSLKNPIVISSSPLSKSVDDAKRAEDAGASAIVMYSLFEEQITHESKSLDHFLLSTSDGFAEAANYFPEPETYGNLEAEEYLEQLAALKRSLSIPVIGSLNGISPGGWMKYAKRIQEAGAAAIELNVYYVATDPLLTPEVVEQMYVENLRIVKSVVSIPVAMKVGPYFTCFANFAKQLDHAGADGLVLFNRFFGPDIDLETLNVSPQLSFSTHWEMRLPLRWIAVLCGQIKASLAASTGIHNSSDVLKMVMAGADVTMIAAAILERGTSYIGTILREISQWMETHHYDSLRQMKGSVSCRAVPDPSAFERANYMKMLRSYQ